MNYKILKHKEFLLGQYKIVAFRHEDIYKIMVWRNEQIDVLRQRQPLTHQNQEKYFNSVVKPTFSQKEPPIMLFSFLLNDKLIGYGGLVYLNWEARRAEVSFLVETERAKNQKTYDEDFSAYLSLLKRAAFEDLNLNRIYTETFAIRPDHINIMEKNGFKYEGKMKGHVKIGGKYVDSLIHAVLKNEYMKKGKK